MTSKSERWKTLLDLGDCEAVSRPIEPQLLEISYSREDGSSNSEVVYEDFHERDSNPRLLVALHSVTALKQLCEHEHARCDKVIETLSKCRAAYYKELRFLRDQLYLAYQTDEEALARKSLLTPDDFEVYWFEPPRYIDPETKDFLLQCIRETNRRLIEENRQLHSEIAKQNILECGVIATVLRQLKKDHNVGTILRELHHQIRTKPELSEFQQVVEQLLNTTFATLTEESEHSAQNPIVDPSVQEELEELRAKTRDQEATINLLRSQLAAGIDVRLERERADAEKQRADLVQQQVERLQRQQKALQLELRNVPDCEQAVRRVRRSVSMLSEAIQSLSQPGSPACSPNVSPKGKIKTSVIMPESNVEVEAADEEYFDKALSHLDVVASDFETVAQDVLCELKDLRNRVAIFETLRNEERLPLQISESAETTAADTSGLEFLQNELAQERAMLALERSRLAEEKDKSLKLKEKLDKAKLDVEQMHVKYELVREKVQKLREKLKSLRSLHGLLDTESDKEDDLDLEDSVDFLVPYRMRAKSGKPRWELLSEDAQCKRKRREHLEQQRLYPTQDTQLASASQEEVFAAFHSLAVPQLSHGTNQKQSIQQQLQRLQQLHQQLQPMKARVRCQTVQTGIVSNPVVAQSPGFNGQKHTRSDLASQASARFTQQPTSHQPLRFSDSFAQPDATTTSAPFLQQPTTWGNKVDASNSANLSAQQNNQHQLPNSSTNVTTAQLCKTPTKIAALLDNMEAGMSWSSHTATRSSWSTSKKEDFLRTTTSSMTSSSPLIRSSVSLQANTQIDPMMLTRSTSQAQLTDSALPALVTPFSKSRNASQPLSKFIRGPLSDVSNDLPGFRKSQGLPITHASRFRSRGVVVV